MMCEEDKTMILVRALKCLGLLKKKKKKKVIIAFDYN